MIVFVDFQHHLFLMISALRIWMVMVITILTTTTKTMMLKYRKVREAPF